MAIAVVGSLGAAATGTTTAAPTFAQSTTAGNCLLCFAATNVSNTLSLTGVSGWAALLTGTAGANVFYKANCGAGETAPTVNGTTFTAGALAEFSGVARSSPLDQEGNSIGTTSPATATLAAADVLPAELIVASTSLLYSMAATKTTTHAYNNGGSATAGASWNNDSTSIANHFRFSYAITTGNGSADVVTITFTTTNITSHTTKGGSALQLHLPPPSLAMATRRPVG